jgi:hypothetical protein
MKCRKYQFMQANTERRALGLRDKIPDIQKTLETVRFLGMRKVRLPTTLLQLKETSRLILAPWDTQEDAAPLESFFELNDTLFAKAEIPRTEEVYLWLGVSIPKHIFLLGTTKLKLP